MNFHKTKVADLQAVTGALDWAGYFRDRGAPEFSEFNLAHPEFFKVFATALKEIPVDDWKTYLRWHLRVPRPALSAALATENFRFFAATMSGVKEQRPALGTRRRHDRRLAARSARPLYVEQTFPAQAKQQCSSSSDTSATPCADASSS